MPLELNLETYRAVLEALPLGVYLVDRERRIAAWNAAAGRISGYLGQEVIGRFCPDNILMHCDEHHRALCGAACPLAHTMQDGRPRESNLFLRHKEGHRVPVRVRAAPIRDESGVIVGSVEFFEERSVRAAETCERRAEDARGDGDMRSVLQRALDNFGATGAPFGVLCMQVDHLDHLRRVYGCQAITTILSQAAQTTSSNIRPDDVAGRWQDNRFAVLVACPNSDGLFSCAQRLKRLVSLTAIPWWGDRLSITMSAGGTMVRAGDTLDSLMARAEEALEVSQAQQADSVLVV